MIPIDQKAVVLPLKFGKHVEAETFPNVHAAGAAELPFQVLVRTGIDGADGRAADSQKLLGRHTFVSADLAKARMVSAVGKGLSRREAADLVQVAASTAIHWDEELGGDRQRRGHANGR